MDDDGSRTLGYEEFKKGIMESGLNVSEDSSKEMFGEFDNDGSGTVSIDEFLRAIRVSPRIFLPFSRGHVTSFFFASYLSECK